MKLLVIFGSSREGRQGEVVLKWVEQHLSSYDNVTLDIADLKEVDLPFYDEVKSIDALGGKFRHAAGKVWNDRVSTADAFIMITPEYNHGPPAILKNAIDYAWEGWNYKPVSFISYSGGAIGGARATEQLRLIVSGVKLLPLPKALHIPRVNEAFDDSLTPSHPSTTKALDALLSELVLISGKLQSTAP